MEGSVAADMEDSTTVRDDDSSSHPPAVRAENYAFLNHSSTTLPNNLPPSVDDKTLSRQKRRRTSPEDQAILEAAYNRDSKPDKVARLELVKQVALGEKEVQIWFQNRRQTTRRKSRPLLPHEIEQYHLARSMHSQFSLDLRSEPTSDDGPLSTAPTFKYAASSGFECRTESSSSPALSQSHSADDNVMSSRAGSQVTTGGICAALSFDSRAAIGYLANRRSAPSLRPDLPVENHGPPWSRPVQSTQPTPSSSLPRLSLTGDGKAQIVTKNGASPSPPRPPQPPADFFDKAAGSQSASREQVHLSNTSEPRSLHRSFSARSRDSRTWEFWCDKDARNELETKAEKDASGSAADAIDLLRSTSGRRVLGALSSRKNNVLSRHTSFVQRKNLGAKPPGLQKASTSLGRLQSNSKSAGNPTAYASFPYKASGDVRIPGNDSDKENWSPRSFEPSESSADDRAASVDENASIRGRGKQDVRPDDVSHSANHKAGYPEPNAEVAGFMRGARKNNSFSEAEDLDCIQGLLSLSQGNWR